MELLFFFATDCPTCQLTAPYLNRLRPEGVRLRAISQDPEEFTRAFVGATRLDWTVEIDDGLRLSRELDPEFVPALVLRDDNGRIVWRSHGFDKTTLNQLAERLGLPPIADPYDGAPSSKPGCGSRHREPEGSGPTTILSAGGRASRVAVSGDDYEFCFEAGFADGLPVVPPTIERVERVMASLCPDELIARIPPNYGAATVEKIAANAVMAGCRPEMMRVLIPLIRAACDERFNLHGIQATTHFATPLVIISGPIRNELGFACGSNAFSNVARANSTLGRAFQLILSNLGGARPGEIDMSTLGNPGKFSYVIAENEEQSPWEPFYPGNAVTLFGAEPPRGVSEHNAREGRMVLKAISRVLATVWSYRVCKMPEAFVILCPEHVQTLARDGFSKQAVREFLFEHTAIPVRHYQDGDGEGVAMAPQYEEVTVDGDRCYRKFARPDQIQIVVAGGTAGKFSAVIGSWATGPRGSQVVTYPI